MPLVFSISEILDRKNGPAIAYVRDLDFDSSDVEKLLRVAEYLFAAGHSVQPALSTSPAAGSVLIPPPFGASRWHAAHDFRTSRHA
jgi:hypothetical protein